MAGRKVIDAQWFLNISPDSFRSFLENLRGKALEAFADDIRDYDTNIDLEMPLRRDYAGQEDYEAALRAFMMSLDAQILSNTIASARGCGAIMLREVLKAGVHRFRNEGGLMRLREDGSLRQMTEAYEWIEENRLDIVFSRSMLQKLVTFLFEVVPALEAFGFSVLDESLALICDESGKLSIPRLIARANNAAVHVRRNMGGEWPKDLAAFIADCIRRECDDEEMARGLEKFGIRNHFGAGRIEGSLTIMPASAIGKADRNDAVGGIIRLAVPNENATNAVWGAIRGVDGVTVRMVIECSNDEARDTVLKRLDRIADIGHGEI